MAVIVAQISFSLFISEQKGLKLSGRLQKKQRSYCSKILRLHTHPFKMLCEFVPLSFPPL